MKHIILLIIASTALLGCGGGGGSGGGNANIQDVAADGIWTGATRVNGFDADTIALVANEKFIAVSVGLDEMYSGSFDVNGDQLSATGLVFQINGSSIVSVTVDGVVTEKGTILATSESSQAVIGDISLLYEADLYERPASLSLVEGSWAASGIIIVITSSGDISGTNSSGCDFFGSTQVIHTDKNLYDVDLTVSNCSVAGQYSGLAFLNSSTDGSVTTIGVAYSNNNFAFAQTLLKL